ncbi:unnamed protein product [Didymodactylos carnosus]|uniref:RNA polymerase-associated protein CTR9-like protein n=1 Tax=Didymodactylos carnosus TaxID=1234261 RepID=A0A8S2H9Z9_9BILA|nr:unnamed protein product [Didymodactylos carnosus]CAF3620593.1 unnamed protein product [Didymodactylos carnosus]
MTTSEVAQRSIEIPLHDSDEVIEVSLDQLPDGHEVLSILQQENCPLHIWVTLALEYYRQEKETDFVQILEAAKNEITNQKQQPQSHQQQTKEQRQHENDQMRCLDTLAAYYVKCGYKEKRGQKKRENFTQATLLYTHADKIMMYDLNHLLGRAYFCLLEGDKMDQAEAQFNFVLNQMPNNIPALLGRACISFNKKDYRSALNLYKRALKNCPENSASIRVGMANCFAKLNKLEKAELSFNRAIQIDPKCVGALVGLAILELNQKRNESIRNGVTKLSHAYQSDPQNPMVLNHLANHFFFKKDYQRVRQLAMHALNYTENEAMRSESCYHLARAHHAERDYEEAFRYYYQATHLAPEKFVLPHFGLGQMYLARSDFTNASDCFEKILKVHPNDHESMKILASIYAESSEIEKRDKAREYLKKVTQHDIHDIDSWIQLAEILEGVELQGALDAYLTASKLIRETHGVDTPVEILNNMGSLYYRLNNYEESKRCFEMGIQNADMAREAEPGYYNSILVTMRYNLARVCEASFEFDKAETLYKEILREHPKYVDCVLRLGCMARDRGQIYNASDWFKDALEINQNNPDAWTMIGNLHSAKQEWRPGQKKFERILHNSSTANDSYAMISLGNIWLQTLYIPTRDKDREKRHQTRALQVYKTVLKNDQRNIWAANGVGCVLAHKNYLNEARDIFAQVREATADFPDVWLNIAHIYVEQKQYIPAVQMYENCLKKFYKYNNVEVLTYLARALVKGNRLKEAHNALLNARRVSPHDLTLMYNVSLVQQKLAHETLKDENSTLTPVLQAIDQLKIAQKTFTWLAENGDPSRIDLNQSSQEARQCSDYLSQSTYHEIRARKKDEEEQFIRRKQDEERKKLREKQMYEEQERRRKDEERRQFERKKREEFVRNCNLLAVNETQEKAERQRLSGNKKRPKQVGEEEEFINDTHDLISNTEKQKKRMKKHTGGDDENERIAPKKKERKPPRKRKVRDNVSGSDEENDAPKPKKKLKERKTKVKITVSDDENDDNMQQEQETDELEGNEDEINENEDEDDDPKDKKRSKKKPRQNDSSGRYKSKATISSSESENEDNAKKTPNEEESGNEGQEKADDDDDEVEQNEQEDEEEQQPSEDEGDNSQVENENSPLNGDEEQEQADEQADEQEQDDVQQDDENEDQDQNDEAAEDENDETPQESRVEDLEISDED